jgi:predicted DNA-binding transcriptional regulator AlpA
LTYVKEFTLCAVRVGRDELVTGAEIARRLGVSRERVRQLAEETGFPPALGRLGASKVWRWADVRAWAKETGRKIEKPR